MRLEERPDLGRLTTFEANRSLPVYRWLWYKEAFSRELAMLLLDELSVDGPVLDPFCGSGTTLLCCKERGLPSYGTDVNPIALTASRAKLADYDRERLAQEMKVVLGSREPTGHELPEDALQVKRFFSADTLKRACVMRSAASEAFYSDFFGLALANAAYECSKVVRDGAVLRPAKKRFIPLAAAFRRNAKSMERDLKRTKFPPSHATVMEGDARSSPVQARSVEAVVTSPPYLGIDDYTKAYAIENFAVGRGLASWIGDGSKAADASRYFADMEAVLMELKRACRPGSRMAMVMWDGLINGRIVGVCESMAKIAESVGLRAEKAWIVNRKPALVNRTKPVGVMRESVIFLGVPR